MKYIKKAQSKLYWFYIDAKQAVTTHPLFTRSRKPSKPRNDDTERSDEGPRRPGAWRTEKESAIILAHLSDITVLVRAIRHRTWISDFAEAVRLESKEGGQEILTAARAVSPLLKNLDKDRKLKGSVSFASYQSTMETCAHLGSVLQAQSQKLTRNFGRLLAGEFDTWWQEGNANSYQFHKPLRDMVEDGRLGGYEQYLIESVPKIIQEFEYYNSSE